MWDVYLGGVSDVAWRDEFKSKISQDITIFDPYLKDYKSLKVTGKTNQFAKELEVQDDCAIAIFYMNSKWRGTSTLLEIGTAVGGGKQVIVCLDGKVKGTKQIQKFCEYHGIPICKSIDELVLTIEEYIGELELLNEN